MAKRGRPPKTGSDGNALYDVPSMVAKINAYTDECVDGTKIKIPIAKECYLNNGWDCDYVGKLSRQEGNEDLLRAIKRLLATKEVLLEQLSYSGRVDRTFAIFSLKQLGWTDNVKQEQNVNVTGKMDTGKLDSILKQLETDSE